MKANRIGAFQICTLAVGALFGCTLPVTAQQMLSLRADSWFPFNGKPDDAKPGYVIEVLKAIYEPSYKVDYQIMPWKRAISEGEKGSIHGIICAAKSDAPAFVFPEEPCGLTDTTFFVKKGSAWTYKDIESLKAVRLGVAGGYAYADTLDAYIKANANKAGAIDESSGDNPLEQGIKKLQAGRIDVYVEVAAVFWAQVDRMNLDRNSFSAAGMLDKPETVFVAFAPGKPESKKLAQAFDEGIRKLRASGTLSTILGRYEIRDWAK